MVGTGPSVISAVLEHLRAEDVEILLANRGLPSVGPKEDLTERLQQALAEEICEWEWENGGVPGYHAEMMGAGCSMVTHNNAIYVFGGMDEDRSEHMSLWKWDLSTEDGFEPVTYRGPVPAKLTAGHFAAVHSDELWVFPGPRNHHMRRVYCLDLVRLRWAERSVIGEPPTDAHWRRNLDALADGGRLIVLGGPAMDRVFFFDFESRSWSSRKCSGGHTSWSFGHAVKRGRSVFAFGTPGASDDGFLEVWELDLQTFRWTQVQGRGTVPPFRIHCSSAVVCDKWIVHGGRRPGKFNVQNQTYVFDFLTSRWSMLMAEGAAPVAREWQRALGLADCMVVVGGRLDIPEFEPVHMTPDTMSTAVEILWFRPPPPPLPPTGRAALLAKVRELCGSGHLADVTLVVAGTHLAAHRHVLAPHSRVFERMWQHAMVEAATAVVHIPDFQAHTMRQLLQYCYGCLAEMPVSHAEAVELFCAADKYDVAGLARECVAHFRRITTADTLAALLLVSSERQSEELREVCIEVASQCLPNIVVAPSFKALVVAQPDLGLGFVGECLDAAGLPSLPEAEAPSQPPTPRPSSPPPKDAAAAASPSPAASPADAVRQDAAPLTPARSPRGQGLAAPSPPPPPALLSPPNPHTPRLGPHAAAAPSAARSATLMAALAALEPS